MAQFKSVQQHFADFTGECKYSSRLSPATVRGYEAVFDLFISLMPEVTDIRLITSEMVIEFLKRLQNRERKIGKATWKTGLKDSTIKTYCDKLGTFIEWLRKRQLINENPIKMLNIPPPRYEDIRELQDEDVKKLYSAIILHAHSPLALRRDIVMISLLIYTGIRRGEFASLEVRDIDFDKQLLFVRANTSKSKKYRYVPIHPTLQLHLRDYITERNKHAYQTPYLIISLNEDKRLSLHGLKHWVNVLSNKSGVNFHLHQFRHAFACNLARKNVNAIKIQKLLGHSSLNMTMTYLRSIGTESMHEDINRLSL